MFKGRIIDAHEATTVFGLVRLCYPDIGFDAWRTHLAGLKRGRKRHAGCVVVNDQRGYVHAACLFRVSPDLRSGRRLEISYLSKAELPASPAPDILFDFVDGLAREEGCSTILIEDSAAKIAEERLAHWTDIDQALVDHDFRPGSVGFVKVVPPAT